MNLETTILFTSSTPRQACRISFTCYWRSRWHGQLHTPVLRLESRFDCCRGIMGHSFGRHDHEVELSRKPLPPAGVPGLSVRNCIIRARASSFPSSQHSLISPEGEAQRAMFQHYAWTPSPRFPSRCRPQLRHAFFGVAHPEKPPAGYVIVIWAPLEPNSFEWHARLKLAYSWHTRHPPKLVAVTLDPRHPVPSHSRSCLLFCLAPSSSSVASHMPMRLYAIGRTHLNKPQSARPLPKS